MRLATLLAALSDEQLELLAVEHVRTDERLARPQLCNFLEGAIRSYRFINGFVINRQPPTFAMLTLLLDAPDHRLGGSEFRDRVMVETRRVTQLISAGDLLARDDQLQLYRRAFCEARRNDLDLNTSEAAILAVLRREKGIAQVEHFLIEHHQEFQEFWDRDDAFEHEANALRSAGILFSLDDDVLIPDDVTLAIRQALGIDMSTESARRLFSYFHNSELAMVLEAAGTRTSGSKESRIERLLVERIQPRVALRSVGLATLKDICREASASVSGNKDDVIERIIGHFAQDKDREEPEPPPPPICEPRRLEQSQFETMFSALTHQELTDILRRFPELRQSGTKETKIRTIWEAQRAETTLLGELMNRQLEDVLHRLRLRLGGSKLARIERVIEHFSTTEILKTILVESTQVQTEPSAATKMEGADVVRNQELFRQKASNPQSSLQPWLDQLLGGNGLVRCYATEDPNPTKQLKNKLSQAAAAQNGLLVLLLSDEASFFKAREALLERWMQNVEWPKSVASVALAYPLSVPTIATIVERSDGPWTRLIRAHLFPQAEVLVAAGSSPTQSAGSPCVQCATGLPDGAKFCPNCGKRNDVRQELSK